MTLFELLKLFLSWLTLWFYIKLRILQFHQKAYYFQQTLKMKKNTSIKTALKSPVKNIKGSQKLIFISNQANQSQIGNQSLRSKIDKVNKMLNQEIKQRQFQFKQMYKMIVQLQRQKESQCLHNILAVQQKDMGNYDNVFSAAELQKNQRLDRNVELSGPNLSKKKIQTATDLGQLNLLKKGKRMSKCELIKSHKCLPGINNSLNSNFKRPIQNQEQNQKFLIRNLQTTSSQILPNNLSDLNSLNLRLVQSSAKSNFSGKFSQKTNILEELTVKINCFQNKLKHLEKSQTVLKQKIEGHQLEQKKINQDLRNLSQKLQSQTHQNKQKFKLYQTSLYKTQQQINLRNVHLCKKYQTLERQSDTKNSQIKSINQQIINLKQAVINQNISVNKITTQILQRYQSQLSERMTRLGLDINLIKQKLQSIAQKEQAKLQLEQIINKNNSEIQTQQTDQANPGQENTSPCELDKLSMSKLEYCSDRMTEIQLRLDTTQEIVSQLIKVSMILTSKINERDSEQSREQRDQINLYRRKDTNKHLKLNQQLNYIGEEFLQTSQESGSQSRLQNTTNIDQMLETDQNDQIAETSKN